MESLRRLRWLACCMLAWFALSAGAAVASPFVAASSAERICSGVGEVRYLVHGAAGAGHTLDCPLCTPSAAPPAGVPGVRPALQPAAQALRRLSVAGQAARPAAPLPARGPPAV